MLKGVWMYLNEKKSTQTHDNFYIIGDLALAQDLTPSVSENTWAQFCIFLYVRKAKNPFPLIPFSFRKVLLISCLLL